MNEFHPCLPISALALRIARSLLAPTATDLETPRRFYISFPDHDRPRTLYRTLNSLGIAVAYLPPWEILPGESSHFFPPNAAARSQAIDAIITGSISVVVAVHKSTAQKIPALSQVIIELSLGYHAEIGEIAEVLSMNGFVRTSNVDDYGQFAVRGDIIDIYSPGGPYRIEFFDTTIDRITRFDVDSQKSVESVDHVAILHFREYRTSPWEAPRCSLFDFLGKHHVHIIGQSELVRTIEQERRGCSAIDPDLLYISPSDIPDWTHQTPSLPLPTDAIREYHLPHTDERLALLAQVTAEVPQVIFTYRSADGLEKFRTMLCEAGVTLPLHLAQDIGDIRCGINALKGDFSTSFYSLAESMLTERDLFGTHQIATRKHRASGITSYLTDLAVLKPGDYVVHIDYGVGIYRGIENLDTAGKRGDFLRLEYQKGDILYVPNEKFNLVQKYIGSEGGSPKLDRIGSKSWEGRKSRARKVVADIAADLIKNDAMRCRPKEHAYPRESSMYEDFITLFPYEETEDQARAIDETLADMYAAYPMDRLVCGDVGYGKTEVALRAAVKCAEAGLQVAVLAPTTILVEQHFRTFRERFAPFPVVVEMVSRFRTAKENREVLEGAANGRVDIVIGTHKLLAKGVEFKRLGLLVIDEEQRFGVVHKERLKGLKANVDVLTLTATPIPRTLHMALGGVKKMSIIETPPKDRRSIRTEVVQFDEAVLRQGLLREFRRGGQIYFLHNRVESIATIAMRVAAVLPEARVGVAHGQMPEAQLERVMLDFSEGEYDVLVCSTIIESGLDVPRANTMFINRADTLGLAQLYQLRGRVGRGDRQAFCYLIVPPRDTMNEDALKRIDIIQELSYLGAGFRLATYDLEMRGAGNIVGVEQSGQIAAVGFEMYTSMLREQLALLTGEDTAQCQPNIRSEFPAFIPEEYVEDTPARLSIYKRIASTNSSSELKEIGKELVDRYGKCPEEVDHLLAVGAVRLEAQQASIEKVYIGKKQFIFHVGNKSKVQVESLIRYASEGKLRLDPDGKVTMLGINPAQAAAFLKQIKQQMK
ncbi:transcription-repair coupling factor [Chrysiogenes arsenatis]|uniref:transcription-repair coupling factor n=1 Tax=Chrysiogenes arsenatis TaxID=309797 RepID=UPI000417A842|nr:transcription-repair coupling factor [Chrysiogenes arsenatis]